MQYRYSDLMDFFYVWLRRVAHSVSNELEGAFEAQLGPKWDAEAGNGELIDDASRFDGDKTLSKQNYEDGMAQARSGRVGKRSSLKGGLLLSSRARARRLGRPLSQPLSGLASSLMALGLSRQNDRCVCDP